MLFLYEFYALQQKGQVCPNCSLIQESNSPMITTELDNGVILYNYECQHCFCEYFKEGPKRKYDAMNAMEYIMEMESMNSKNSKNKKNKIF
jgi:hypothetical protein